MVGPKKFALCGERRRESQRTGFVRDCLTHNVTSRNWNYWIFNFDPEKREN